MKKSLSGSLAVGFVVVLASAPPVQADPEGCQTAIARHLARFKKVHLKAHLKCLRLENLGRIDGPCPDQAAQDKIDDANATAVAKIAIACMMTDIAALGFPSDCAFDATPTGIEAQCAGLPVSTVTEVAECLKCWKGAELSEYMATLFASHAVALCDGSVDATSPVCSDLECTTPLPEQHDLGDSGENDCQVGIGKAGVKYLLKREKILEKCALAGGTQASCLGDQVVQDQLASAETAKQNLIHRKCGNRTPTAAPPFCCKDGGPGNSCTVVANRDDCISGGGTVQEGKTCALDLTCDPVPGPNQAITWWENCPESNSCPGTALADINDLIDCVDSAASAIVDELLCFQFPRNGGADWPCPTEPE